MKDVFYFSGLFIGSRRVADDNGKLVRGMPAELALDEYGPAARDWYGRQKDSIH